MKLKQAIMRWWRSGARIGSAWRRSPKGALYRPLGIICLGFSLLFVVAACARMGSPDGGWYDETPPHVIGAEPADQATGVNSRKIHILFDEFVKIDNPSQNVVVSPPQLEPPEIKGQGKRISVQLMDSLQPNTTYTVDFSNAITDNNEGNPLGNYTYTFSTGDHIDTLEVSGYVLNAEDLEPVQGMLVGLYSDLADSAFQTLPMLRVSRTDDHGHFTIKGVAPGQYRVYALQDADGNYFFNQKSEAIGYNHDVITPSFRPDIRQDTIWTDSLHIASIARVPYTHFLPDDICLRAFQEVVTDRYLVKSERPDPFHFTIVYSYGDTDLPELRGLNFNAADAFLVQPSEKRDTITYWLRDTALIKQDTLDLELTHHITDTLGTLQMQKDTLTLISRTSYERYQKDQEKKANDWRKQQERKRKRGEPYDSIMPPEELKVDITPQADMDPDQNISFTTTLPLNQVDSAMIHLYAHPAGDSLWYQERFELERVDDERYRLRAEWRPAMEYSLEVDSAAFTSIYGATSRKVKRGLKVRSLDAYASLLISVSGFSGKHLIGELIDKQGRVIKKCFTDNGDLEFFYLRSGEYYVRVIVDDNGNGEWDTGDYKADRQPEAVYYYPEKIECREKWDMNLTWNPTERPLYQQKPDAITKQKGKTKKTIRNRNQERARELGLDYVPKQ